MVPTPERVDGTNGIKVFRDVIKFNAKWSVADTFLDYEKIKWLWNHY